MAQLRASGKDTRVENLVKYLSARDGNDKKVCNNWRNMAQFLTGFSEMDLRAVEGCGEATVMSCKDLVSSNGARLSDDDRTYEGTALRKKIRDQAADWTRCPTCETLVRKSKLKRVADDLLS